MGVYQKTSCAAQRGMANKDTFQLKMSVSKIALYVTL
jgi:hypothetical protein